MPFKNLILVILCIFLSGCFSAPIAYITNQGSNTVSVVDIKKKKNRQEISVGNGPVGIAISLKQSHAYISNANDSSVSVLDLQLVRLLRQSNLTERQLELLNLPTKTISL